MVVVAVTATVVVVVTLAHISIIKLLNAFSSTQLVDDRDQARAGLAKVMIVFGCAAHQHGPDFCPFPLYSTSFAVLVPLRTPPPDTLR